MLDLDEVSDRGVVERDQRLAKSPLLSHLLVAVDPSISESLEDLAHRRRILDHGLELLAHLDSGLPTSATLEGQPGSPSVDPESQRLARTIDFTVAVEDRVALRRGLRLALGSQPDQPATNGIEIRDRQLDLALLHRGS